MLCTHIEVVRQSNDREEPKNTVKPADISVKPAWVVVYERLQDQVECIYGGQ